MKSMFKNNAKTIIAFVLGLAIAGTIGVYAYTISSSNVSYDNSSSGLTSDNVKGALDDLYDKASNGIIPSTYRITLSNEAITTTSSVRRGWSATTLNMPQNVYGYTKIKVVSSTLTDSIGFTTDLDATATSLTTDTTYDLPEGYQTITITMISTTVRQGNCVIELSKD